MQCQRIIRIIAVGRMKDKTFDARCREFITWINKYGKCELTVVPDSDVSGEGAAICRELDRDRNAAVFILTEEGRQWSTVEFAGKLEALDCKALFVIGGPFGLADEVKQRGTLWSLSKLTFTHEFARLLLCEQLYRAMNYLNGGAYHHI